MCYLGIDIIEIDRIRQVIARRGEGFLKRVYTQPEINLYHHKPSSLAARFAAKEAVVKALGAKALGISWQDIEILSDPTGRPLVQLYGRAKNRAAGLGLDNLAISLSHSREYAVACVAGMAK